MSETFNESEIFVKTSTKPYDNSADFEITELKSVYLGRCYMVCFKKANSVAAKTYVWIKKNMDLIGDCCMHLILYFTSNWKKLL